jgi:hypothetical protein
MTVYSILMAVIASKKFGRSRTGPDFAADDSASSSRTTHDPFESQGPGYELKAQLDLGILEAEMRCC